MGTKGISHICTKTDTVKGKWIVDLSDVVGASPVDAASTTSSFST